MNALMSPSRIRTCTSFHFCQFRSSLALWARFNLGRACSSRGSNTLSSLLFILRRCIIDRRRRWTASRSLPLCSCERCSGGSRVNQHVQQHKEQTLEKQHCPFRTHTCCIPIKRCSCANTAADVSARLEPASNKDTAPGRLAAASRAALSSARSSDSLRLAVE